MTLKLDDRGRWFALKTILIFVCLHSVLFGANSRAQETDAFDIGRYQAVKDPSPIEGFAYQRYFTRDKFDRRITFYLSKTSAEKKLPLVVCIQGSGSQSIFLKHQGMIASGGPESVVTRDFRDRVRIVVVEKPAVAFLSQPGRPGSAKTASDEFQREFSLPRWVEAVSAATRAARTLPFIDQSKLLVLGHSEGGQVACEVAANIDQVTHVAVMAGGGPTQLFDLLQQARSGDMYDPEATPDQRVSALLADWKRVMEAPNATDKFILGHSHLRWSTFLASSPIEAILRSKAKVFVAQGTDDKKSLPASAEVLVCELWARGRDCTYERVVGADHGFMTPDDEGAGWEATNKKAVDWFLAD